MPPDNLIRPVEDRFCLANDEVGSYLVLPRSALETMSTGWQIRFVACVNEMIETIDFDQGLPFPYQYRVTLWDDYETRIASIKNDPFYYRKPGQRAPIKSHIRN